MNASVVSTPTAEPTKLSAARYVGGVSGGAVAFFTVAALFVAMIGRGDVWFAYRFVAMTTAAALLASFAVVAPMLRGETTHAAFALLAAGLLRAAVLAAGVIVAIKLRNSPQVPTLLLAMISYLAIVAIEAVVCFTASPNFHSVASTREPA